ncbi:hypothetical protein ACGFS9_27515 [Streptomyces sp. NPDC048566]|uniref:hypothetical protein n=1 Tax=Streptomyces sp. NPDC048566 TaxID=3365569 RepID=UPI003715FDBE
MRHVPFFRWVLTLGFVLFTCAVGLYAFGPGLPDTRQIDLTVLDEKPDGACRVRWHDPYQDRTREEPYRCDPGRSDLLKAPQWADGGGYGWESGFMLTEGRHRGDLEDAGADTGLGSADVFLLLGAPLVTLGLIGGNLRALPRTLGVRAPLVRRAMGLSSAAARVADDYERALAAVREAGRHADLSRDTGSGPGARLVTALWVLKEAGPSAGETAARGRAIARRLDGLLQDTAPSADLRSSLRAGPVARARAGRAVAELGALLAEAERDGLPERCAQTSVDLLRGQDAEWAALAAATDFARDPAAYRHLLARWAPAADPPPARPAARTPWWRRRR